MSTAGRRGSRLTRRVISTSMLPVFLARGPSTSDAPAQHPDIAHTMRGSQETGPAMTNSTKTATRELAPFGELLVRLRAAAGLTQEQLAAQAGLSTAAITALESGKRRAPRFTTVELLATALGLDAQHRQELVRAARDPNRATARDPRRPSWRTVAEPTPLLGRVHELDLIVHSPPTASRWLTSLPSATPTWYPARSRERSVCWTSAGAPQWSA